MKLYLAQCQTSANDELLRLGIAADDLLCVVSSRRKNCVLKREVRIQKRLALFEAQGAGKLDPAIRSGRSRHPREVERAASASPFSFAHLALRNSAACPFIVAAPTGPRFMADSCTLLL